MGNGLDVMLYYWDDRDGPNFCGWWFGPKVGGDQVWAYHPDKDSLIPPGNGWKVPYDGPTDPTFTLAMKPGSGTAVWDNRSKCYVNTAAQPMPMLHQGYGYGMPAGYDGARRQEEEERRRRQQQQQQETEKRRVEEKRRIEEQKKEEEARQKKEIEEKRRQEQKAA